MVWVKRHLLCILFFCRRLLRGLYTEIHFGKTADEIIRIEDKVHKNDPDRHAKRLDNLIKHWDEILRIIDEELPAYEELYAKLAATGMPMTPKDIDVPVEDVVNSFVGSRDIRDKYLSCSFLWDLGLTEEYAEHLKEIY